MLTLNMQSRMDANTLVALMEAPDLEDELDQFIAEVEADRDRHWLLTITLGACFSGMIAYTTMKSGKSETDFRQKLATKMIADLS